MKYIFYHDPFLTNLPDEDGVRIWIPDNDNKDLLINYLKSKKNDCEVKYENYVPAQSESFQHIPRRKKIALYAQSDTLANSVNIIAKGLKDHDIFFIIPQYNPEGSDAFFDHHECFYSTYSYSLLKHIRPDMLVLLNDWAKEPQRIIAHCRFLKIPTICIQESVIDFGDRFKRMTWADYVFVQGIQTVVDLKRSEYFVTGNPRYEGIGISDGVKKYALINCNFTYGIFEGWRDRWLEDINDALSSLDIEYCISQHPRDTGDLSKYKNVIPSSSSQVHDQLIHSKFLITRFSSLIHESLVMGIPVIYYNPHGEKMKYDFGFNDSFIFLATNPDELKNAVVKLNATSVDKQQLNEYLVVHCLPDRPGPVENIAWLLSNYTFKPSAFKCNDLIKIIVYHPFVKRILGLIRQRVFK